MRAPLGRRMRRPKAGHMCPAEYILSGQLRPAVRWPRMTLETVPHRATIEVAPVRGPLDIRAFVALPFRLHRGTPWIPPLKVERYMFLTRRLNPYFKHGVAEYFLARHEGRVVGRITAQVDHAFNEYHRANWGMFGFLEFEN